MMRELETVEFHQGIPHQIGIQVDVPTNATPGTYAVLALGWGTSRILRTSRHGV